MRKEDKEFKEFKNIWDKNIMETIQNRMEERDYIFKNFIKPKKNKKYEKI